MKLLVVLMLCGAVLAAPKASTKLQFDEDFEKQMLSLDASQPETRNIAINLLIRQLISILRNVINNGSSVLGIRPLDPLKIEDIHVYFPTGLINLDLQLKDVHATGFGGFVVHRSSSNVRQVSLDLDISIPRLVIKAGKYDLIGDLFKAIPIYGKGEAHFEVENFRFQAKAFLGQSEDGKSIIINRIENAAFQLPHFKSNLTGAIGGGDIDKIVNAVIEDVIIGYVNRFQGAVAFISGHVVKLGINPILEHFDSWRFIAPFV